MSQPKEPKVSFPSPFVCPRIKFVATKLVAREPATPYGVASPAEAALLLHRLVGLADREHFVAFYLDTRHQVTHVHVVSVGALAATLVHPREVFKGALLANAFALIVGHNHPSGEVTPSMEDEAMTARLRRGGELLGIELLDSLIVGPERRFFSCATGQALDLPKV